MPLYTKPQRTSALSKSIAKHQLKVETLPTGHHIVKRYRKGRCFAAVWSSDTTPRQIQSQMAQGDACFFPFNESTGQFLWHLANRPTRFRR